MDPLLRVINVSKCFGNLWALENVTFDILPGEVVGVAGSSGSGKSVLVNVIAGVYTPTSGDLYFDEWRYSTLRPNLDATLPWVRKLGLEVIYQKPELVGQLDITSNIFLGRELAGGHLQWWLRWSDRNQMDAQAAHILDDLGVHFESLHEKAINLSSEECRIVAIARALVGPARLIVIDEPLLGLSLSLQQKMLTLIQRWQAQGRAVLMCSNDLRSLFAVTDRIMVLNEGHRVAVQCTDETSQEEIVALLVGAPPPGRVPPIIWALDSYYQAREQAEALQQNQMLLQQNLAEQDSLNRQLLEQLAQQVAVLDRVNGALQDAQRRLLLEREDERKHLARELHDEVIQDLLGLGYQIEELAAALNSAAALPVAPIQEMQAEVRRVIDDLRRICSDLRPPVLDSLGLGAAIRSHAQQWAARHHITLTLDIADDLGRIPEATELSVFRIVQEGLNNIHQHALATEARVILKHPSPRMLHITLSDNGTGIDKDDDLATLAAKSHFGLLGISERVALLGGTLQLQNRLDGGLLLQVEIPHPRVVKPLRFGAS